MKATAVLYTSEKPTDGKRRPTLTPELSAAVAARHSRNADGLDSILSLVESMPQDKAVDSIFKFTDYGHRSILDMVPASIHLEGISLFAATMLWYLIKQGGGQERSTRYCSFKTGGMFMETETSMPLLEAYEKATGVWSAVAESVAFEGKNEKVTERLRKNFVFDRSRYFIPFSCLTSMNVTTWGVEWARVLSLLASSPWTELRGIADAARLELGVVAPHCVKHSHPTVCNSDWWDDLLNLWSRWTPFKRAHFESNWSEFPDNLDRQNRYDPCELVRRTHPVKYGFDYVTLAELRDMNRHRPGERLIILSPHGFYGADDEAAKYGADICDAIRTGASATTKFSDSDDCDFVYSLPLGALVGFHHTSTLGNLIYEIELRTGPGTHFKYRGDYLELYQEVRSAIPGIGKLLIGSGEPE